LDFADISRQVRVHIVNDKEFSESNQIFAAKCVQLKNDGLAKVQHKPAIHDADLKKLYECGVFDTNNPRTLLNKVFFEIILCFCHRGRQNLRQLKKNDFLVHTDSAGTKYVLKIIDEMTKNHRENDEAEEGGVIYETGSPFCPVASFEKYLGHSTLIGHCTGKVFKYASRQKHCRVYFNANKIRKKGTI
jgi:hypothetical protein